MRLFAACDLTHNQKHELEAFQGRLGSYINGVRWVKPQGFHLTLFFLGETDADLIGQVKDAFTNAARSSSPFLLKLGGCGVFPSASQARVLWVGVKEGEEGLKQLKVQLDQNLSKLGFEPEKRNYKPHLTLGRMRYNLDQGLIKRYLDENPLFSSSPVLVEDLVLYESRLTSQGALYYPLEKFKLANVIIEDR